MKLLIVFALGFLLSWTLKGNMGITPDHQIQLGVVTVPVPESARNSPAFAMVTMMMGNLEPNARQAGSPGPASSAVAGRAAPAAVAAPAPPVLPVVTSVSSTL